MTKTCNPADNEFSPFHILSILTIIGTECIIGIVANGFIMAINTAEWIKNKAVSNKQDPVFLECIQNTSPKLHDDKNYLQLNIPTFL